MQTRSKETTSSGTRQRASGQKRESGSPGGGQGRRDVVRGSKVYPMSGPLPRGNAVVRGEAEWGQGERGAAGYEDSGESGLESGYPFSKTGSKTSRTAKTGSRTAERQESFVSVAHEIPQYKWTEFFNDFNRRHAGWLAEVEVRGQRRDSQVEARQLPFAGITADTKPGARSTISVIMEMQSNIHLTHLIPRSRVVRVIEEPEMQIEIVAANGEHTVLHFKEPRRESEHLLAAPKSKRTEAG